MTREEAIRELKADYCGNRIICELYPDQCNREDCEIWLAIKALVEQPIRVLETQPEVAKDTNVLNNDCISRQAAIDALAEDMPQAYTPDGLHPADEGIFMAQEIYADCIQTLKELPSAQPDAPDTNVGDMISRQNVLRCLTDISYNHCKTQGEADVIDTAKTMVAVMPSAHAESTRTFVELVVEYPDPELCTYKEYRGKPYYSIKYIENGETYVGYGTYNPEVLSQYLKEYFISSAQPDITPDGTLTVSIDADIANVGRILLSQTGTQRGGLYYKDEQPEIIRCRDCKFREYDSIFDGHFCRNRRVKLDHFCGYAERRTDG